MWSYRKDTDVSNSDNLPQIRPNSRESFKREIIKLPEEEFNVRTELLERESFISKTNVSNAGKQNIIEVFIISYICLKFIKCLLFNLKLH